MNTTIQKKKKGYTKNPKQLAENLTLCNAIQREQDRLQQVIKMNGTDECWIAEYKCLSTFVTGLRLECVGFGDIEVGYYSTKRGILDIMASTIAREVNNANNSYNTRMGYLSALRVISRHL